VVTHPASSLVQDRESSPAETSVLTTMLRVPTPPGKSWIFFLKIPGPGKSWKLKLKVLESPGKISLKVMHFSSGSNGKQAAMVLHILLHAEFSAMDYILNIVSKCRFSLYLNIRGPRKGAGEFFMGSWKVLEKSWIFCQ